MNANEKTFKEAVFWQNHLLVDRYLMRGRNRIGRREKWPKKSWEGEIGGKSREEGEKKS